jgi:hypothetical protein
MRISKKDQKLIIIGLMMAVIFVVIGVLVFSYAMETLDVQAEILGAKEKTIWIPPFQDYTIVGFENEVVSILLGATSTGVIFLIALGVAMLLKK